MAFQSLARVTNNLQEVPKNGYYNKGLSLSRKWFLKSLTRITNQLGKVPTLMDVQ